MASKLLLAWHFASWLSMATSMKNPIIPGWNPDPSILRVGSDYYIATSSFEYYPGIPIYKSTDLANWELYSHAFTTPETSPLYGVPTNAGLWAPSLSCIDGKVYLASMSRWTYDPTARVWPRVYFASSTNLKDWSNLTWCEPWGIDPSLFQDPVTNRTYLNLMAPNNNIDRIWGIYQCEVSLKSGHCIGEYRSLWDGTLPHNNSARIEGPKMTYKDGFYYLLCAEGGTDDQHRSTIARSRSPEGPFVAAPNNPLLFNGAWGFDNLTVQSTGHATMVETPKGDWYAVFLARRKINGTSPLGRETFLTTVSWSSDGWPVFNDGGPVLLSETVGNTTIQQSQLSTLEDNFSASVLNPDWYQLRTPYTSNFELTRHGLVLHPNVFGLSDRDVPAALLRKQKSLNMTFSATLLGAKTSLGPYQTIGISAYLSEFQHQDIGVRGCINGTGMCLYTQLWKNHTSQYSQIPLNHTEIPANLTLHIKATPLLYQLGYSVGNAKDPIFLAEISSAWQAFAPPNYFVFEGNSFAVFASGNGQPWPHTAPPVGFTFVREEYGHENIPDYDVW